MIRIATICVLICMMLTNAASAAVTYNVTGTVNGVINNGVVAPPIGVGSSLTGQFTFEVLTPRSGGGSDYSFFEGAVTLVSLTLSGSPSITIVGTGLAQTLDHVDSGLGIIDSLLIDFTPSTGATAPAIEGLSFAGGALAFADTTDTVFSTDPPPLVNPDQSPLSPWIFNFAWVNYLGNNYSVNGAFAINRQQTPGTSVVPVPGALLLGGIGAGLVSLLRRRRTLQ